MKTIEQRVAESKEITATLLCPVFVGCLRCMRVANGFDTPAASGCSLGFACPRARDSLRSNILRARAKPALTTPQRTLFAPSHAPSGLTPQTLHGVICNIKMAVFSQSYFPALFGDKILPRSSSFNFFFLVLFVCFPFGSLHRYYGNIYITQAHHTA